MILLAAVIICDLQMYSPIYSIPWKLWHELYITTSESACLKYGAKRGAIHTFPLPTSPERAVVRCGKDLVDCPEVNQ